MADAMEQHAKSNLDRSERVKIRFPLSKQDREDGVEAENLWAEDLGRGRYAIDSIPFFVYGISNRDTVAATRIEDRLCFDKVVDRGGHSTYRVLLKDQTGYESEAFKDLRARLEALSCKCELARRRLVAIDVPANADADAAYEILEAGKTNGVWAIDEGHCGHPV